MKARHIFERLLYLVKNSLLKERGKQKTREISQNQENLEKTKKQ